LEDIPRGTTIRRFVVLGRIGAGAMGVVYAAYDYTLERKLALKLVRGEHVLEEAQALAKLSHRNVVAIYDVGTYGERVYIAMEHVDGGTLRAWLATPHTPDQILGVLLDAGAGLAAAHAAGLVHGDFKPENVMIDTSGRCVVGDFGLARPAGAESRGATPAYAAPEEERTAASDQFSFCVTAYEALFGERPFGDGDSQRELRAPPESDLPAIRAVLVRGLALAPADRWPAMTDLLAALTSARTPKARARARVLIAGALVAAAVVGGSATMLVRHDREPPCDPGSGVLAKVWSPARRALLQQRLPADTFRRVAETFDHYTTAWSDMRVSACRATRVEGTQSEALLDLRTACLQRRLAELDAELDALGGVAAADLASAAIDASHALSPIAGCADIAALQSPTHLPGNPAARAAITAQTTAYAKAKALYDTGRHREGLVAARELVESVRTLGYRPLEAEALHLRGRLELELTETKAAEASLLDAIAAAQAGNARDVLARSWLDLIWVVGELASRYDEAERLGVMARGAVEQDGSPPMLAATLEDRLGVIAFDRGDFATAKQRLERALAMREEAFGKSGLEVAASLQHVALLRTHDGDDTGALAMQQRAFDIYLHELGPEHAATGALLASVGAAQYAHHEVDAAIATWRRALVIAEKAHGEHSFDAAAIRTSLALGLRDKGQFAEAVATSKRGLDDFMATVGDAHADAPGYIMNHGYMLLANREFAAAEQEMTRALGLLEKHHGIDAPEIATAWVAIGTVRYEAGDAAKAIAPYAKALDLRERHGARPVELAASKIELAEALGKSGVDRARAVVLARAARGAADDAWRARADAVLAAYDSGR
jgi:tetratricopeptide (TPR) repeat protein